MYMSVERYVALGILIVFLVFVAMIMSYMFIYSTKAPKLSKDSIFHLVGGIILLIMLVGIAEITIDIALAQD